MASKSGDVFFKSGRGSEGYDDQKFRSRSHAVQRFALATWGAVPRSLVMFCSMEESFMTTFSRTTATDAFPFRCVSAEDDKAWKTQMRADRGSRTPFELGLALENPWQGDPPAKRTCVTFSWRSRMERSRRHLSSVRARTEPTCPDLSLSSERRSHSDSPAFALRTALAGESVSNMIILMPEAWPGGMPSELRACQQPPIPEKRSNTRILAGWTPLSLDGGRAGGGAFGLVASARSPAGRAGGERALGVLWRGCSGGASVGVSLPPREAVEEGGSCCQTEAAPFLLWFLSSSNVV